MNSKRSSELSCTVRFRIQRDKGQTNKRKKSLCLILDYSKYSFPEQFNQENEQKKVKCIVRLLMFLADVGGYSHISYKCPENLPSGDRSRVPSGFALESGTLSGKGLYLTLCPWSSPNTDTVEEMESYPYSEERHILPMNLS